MSDTADPEESDRYTFLKKESYKRLAFDGYITSSVLIYMCHDCGSLVFDPHTHDVWHDSV